MNILMVVHGYPPRFNAGSEVYTQALTQTLADRHQVLVFCRQEDPFLPAYGTTRESDIDDARVPLVIVNLPRFRDCYRHPQIDAQFEKLVREFRPDVVHVQHLNHLSTSLLAVPVQLGVPIIYTLHDFWLMCPRGQFIQMFPEDNEDVYALCDGQDHVKCARHCYRRYYSGAPGEVARDESHWTDWVQRRMEHVREMLRHVDRYIAPSRHLLARYRDEFGLPADRLTFLDYGFNLDRLRHRRRTPDGKFVFGYIGTHIPAKGIHHLIEAFARVQGDCHLKIWGRHTLENTKPLKLRCERLLPEVSRRIMWCDEYRNTDIVHDVFNQVDAIVVPSIWLENSPLVIHEAQQARVPVITADAGGMAEYVKHEVNGLLFEHRNPTALAKQMQRFVDQPEWAATLGTRGYYYSKDGDVPSMKSHVAAIESIYNELLTGQRSSCAGVRVQED